MASERIRLAIVGGGLTGACIANALIQIPHLDINVYESSPEFSERGAAIGIDDVAQKSLLRILPSASKTLSNAGAVPMNSTRLLIGSGPSAGDLIFDLGGKGDPGLIIHRASLLRELLATLPGNILHTRKKARTVVPNNDGVEIIFEDGTAGQFDCVIGADGIFSNIRKYVLDDDDTFAASPAGFWDCRNLVPYEKAKAMIGEEHFELDRQFGWAGDGAFIMHDVLENRTMVQCVISATEADPPADRKHPLTRESLTETLRGWIDGPIAKGMIDLMLDQPSPYGYSQYEHKSTPTYAKGRVCVVGDAAHATTPWQGYGAGMAMEDAMVLGALFRNISSSNEIDALFKAFDSVRRQRCEQIIHSSKGTGELFCGRVEGVGLDIEKIRQALAPRWKVINSIDHERHEKDALDKLKEILGTSN